MLFLIALTLFLYLFFLLLETSFLFLQRLSFLFLQRLFSFVKLIVMSLRRRSFVQRSFIVHHPMADQEQPPRKKVKARASSAKGPAAKELDDAYHNEMNGWCFSNVRAKIDPDVILEVEGKEIAAHKLVLSAASSTFLSMLYGIDMRESQHNRVVIEATAYGSMSLLVDFCYASNFELDIDMQYVDILLLADRYDMQKIVTVLSHRIALNIEQLSVHQIMTILECIHSTGLRLLGNILKERLFKNHPVTLTVDHVHQMDTAGMKLLHVLYDDDDDEECSFL